MSSYGYVTGDVLHLGDTGLRLRIPERAFDSGDEFQVGFGNTGRDGIGLHPVTTSESCDVVVTNVVILDAVLGIRVASIGIRAGRISAIGKAGNPNVAGAVDIIIGSGTVVIPGDGLIATAGGVDTHVHTLSPRVLDAEIASGITTVIGQEAGPMWGVGVNSPWVLGRAMRAMDAFPLNIGLLGRASSSVGATLDEAVRAHVCGLKVHEDTGATLRTIDTALRCADAADIKSHCTPTA